MYVIPEIDEAKALILLAKNPRPLTRKRKIIKAELVFLPCYLFSIEIETKKGIQLSETVCLDGIQGQFAFFTGAKFTEAPLLSGQMYNFVITPQQAKKIAQDDYNRYLFKQNLKNKTRAVVQSITLDQEIHYPYWIGYFTRKQAYDFDVIDGLGGKYQGAKMRSVFIELLLQENQKYRRDVN